ARALCGCRGHRRPLHRGAREPRQGALRRSVLAHLRALRRDAARRARDSPRAGAPEMKPTPAERAKNIKAIVFDVDGVLTDGGLWYGPTGEAMKRFDVKDGHAMVLARLTGLPVALLTARSSNIVEVRAAELKLAKVFQGRREKGPAFEELCAELGVAPAEVA